MAGRNFIVIGASAGSMEALQNICGGLPGDLRAAVFVVVHTGLSSPRVLPQLLDRVGALRADYAHHGESIQLGRIYVAPPDRHLLLGRGVVRLTVGPKENGFRPAVDPLFRTAARQYGRRVIGVVLSGGMDDGTEGLSDIKSAGGVAIVQDPQDALLPSMPMNALRQVAVDHVLPATRIAATLVELVNEPLVRKKSQMAKSRPGFPRDPVESGGEKALQTHRLKGSPSALTCPECGGAIWEVRGRGITRYRCHVGHSYSEQSMLSEQDASVEAALWAAVRALEEKASLRQRLAEHATQSNLRLIAQDYAKGSVDARAQAGAIREVLTRNVEGNENGKANINGNGNGNGKKASRRKTRSTGHRRRR